jgi:8-amino-7-oxononanoate synthase
MSDALRDRVSALLATRAQSGLKRSLVVCEASHVNQIRRAGFDVVDFSSNDYLGLRADPVIKSAFANAAARYGLGAGASHLLGGHHPAHVALEQALCLWTNRPAAALFASGFQAALGAFGALAAKGDLVVADRLAHACLLDGARYCNTTLRRFRHNSARAAADLLQADVPSNALRWLVSESVFSMDGDQAPLPELVKAATATGATLFLDEAHAVGVLGPNGAGLAAEHGLDSAACPVLMLTFGKAIGSAGAAILGTQATIDAITNFARPWIYTTAMPPALAWATAAAIERAQAGADLRAQLQANVRQFRELAHSAGLPLADSAHAIQPILLGDQDVVALSARLMQQGFYVPAVRPPTVPKGEARLRVSLNSKHTAAQIAGLVRALAQSLAQSFAAVKLSVP